MKGKRNQEVSRVLKSVTDNFNNGHGISLKSNRVINLPQGEKIKTSNNGTGSIPVGAHVVEH